MKWFAIETRLISHPKMRRALTQNRGALEMWIAMRSFVAEHETDGTVPDECVEILGGAPRNPRRALLALVDNDLIHKRGTSWRFHDFDDHAREAYAVHQKREAERIRKRRQRERERGCPADGHVTDAVTSHVTNGGTSGVSPEQHSPLELEEEREIPREEDPKDPTGQTAPKTPPGFSSSRKSDAAFGQGAPAPGKRPDVLQLHATWRTAIGLPHHTLRGDFGLDATELAECIDAHGIADCLLVAKHCAADGMVSGKLDDKGRDHRTIKYIFGNPDTFHRILGAARERERLDGKRRPASELMREALAR